MITCPLCNYQVQSKVDHKPLLDGSADDYYCPNMITMDTRPLCHFSRRQYRQLVDGQAAYTYQALVPPFQITYITNCKVSVYKVDNKGDREANDKPYYQSKNKTGYGEFIKTCKRFKGLVIFS